jgi:hypothetical protein
MTIEETVCNKCGERGHITCGISNITENEELHAEEYFEGQGHGNISISLDEAEEFAQDD